MTLHTNDNVLICCQMLKVNELISINDSSVKVLNSIDVGHKVAKAPLKTGDKVIRYGVSIGSATKDINIGEHVHMHNMKSDYISSHTRQSIVGEN